MSGSDRAGRLPRSRCLSLYGLLSAAPAGLPAPEPSYDKLVTLAIEPGSNGLWRVHKSCWDQMAPVFALRTRKSHGDLRSWPPNFARVRTRQTFARPFICGRFKDVWPDSHLGFKDVFCVQAAFWCFGQAFPQRCARGSEGWPIARRRDLSSSIDDFGAHSPTCSPLIRIGSLAQPNSLWQPLA